MQAFYRFLTRSHEWTDLTSRLRETIGDATFERLLAIGVLQRGGRASQIGCGAGRTCRRTVVELPPGLPCGFSAICGRGPGEGCEPVDLTAAELETHQVVARRLAEFLQAQLGARGPLSIVPQGPWSLGVLAPTVRDVFLVPRPVAFQTFVLERRAAPRATLALVPLSSSVPEPFARQHGPGEKVEIAYLEDLFPAVDGRLTRDLSGTAAGERGLSTEPARAPVVALEHGTRWRDVHVHRVDGHTVSIRVGALRRRLSYVDLGMASAKNREPTKQWDLLMTLCENEGKLPWTSTKEVTAMKRRVSYLRDDLKSAFGLDEDPFEPYVAGKGYCPRFRATDQDRSNED